MNVHNLNPHTRGVRAASVRPGHVIVESHAHPAVVERVAHRGTYTFWCRYVWQSAAEPVWPLGPFHPDSRIDLSVER